MTEDEVTTEHEELWFDPLTTIEVISYAMCSIAETDFDGKQTCLNDFAAVLEQCNIILLKTLQAYNLKEGFIKTKKKQ